GRRRAKRRPRDPRWVLVGRKLRFLPSAGCALEGPSRLRPPSPRLPRLRPTAPPQHSPELLTARARRRGRIRRRISRSGAARCRSSRTREEVERRSCRRTSRPGDFPSRTPDKSRRHGIIRVVPLRSRTKAFVLVVLLLLLAVVGSVSYLGWRQS